MEIDEIDYDRIAALEVSRMADSIFELPLYRAIGILAPHEIRPRKSQAN